MKKICNKKDACRIFVLLLLLLLGHSFLLDATANYALCVIVEITRLLLLIYFSLLEF